jgi:hypothetical protein
MPLRMIARLAAALGTVGFVGCSLTGSGAVEDELRIAGLKAGESVVVMLKARTAEAGCRDGRNGDAWVFRSTGRTRLGNVLSARNDCVSEIVIASENHAMLVEAVNTWTDAPGDVVSGHLCAHHDLGDTPFDPLRRLAQDGGPHRQ